jgi:hypothetical protein
MLSRAQSRAKALTIRAIRLSRAAAEAGRTERGRQAWAIACHYAFRMGGLSGCDATGGVILFPDGRVIGAPHGCVVRGRA